MKIGDPSGIGYWAQPFTSKVLQAAVDWLTVTCSAEDNPKHLYGLGHELIAAEAERGNDVTTRRRQGYDGLQCGSAYVGDRDDGVIVSVSAHVAAAAWKSLLEVPGRPRRVDLQVTAAYDPPQPTLALDAFHGVPTHPTHRGRARTVSVRANRGGGDTLYLGSRASAVCGRHYDKGVEQGTAEPGKEWRWELETKGGQAISTSTGMVGMANPLAYITNQVWSWFWSWGLKPGFPRRPCP